PTPTLKVVLLGDSGVGKTCLRSQFVHHVFTNAYKATIGGDYLTTTVVVPSQLPEEASGPSAALLVPDDTRPQSSTKVNLQVWDTAGQERFNSISQAFYRGTDVCVLVYDITNYESVLSIRDWFKRFMEHCHVERPGVVIVGNKLDRSSERCVDAEEIRDILVANASINVDEYVVDWDTDLKEVSSKTLELVQELFLRVAQIGIEAVNDGRAHAPTRIQGFD
ncbi:ras-domain-containing protein, partial [Suhomyces tanzawaensis NRRL Y-17324]